MALVWRDLDLSDCPPLAITGGALAGRAEGAANLVLKDGSPPTGEGSIQLRDAFWRAAGAFGLDTLHADTAFLRWQVAGDGRLRLSTIDLHGPDLVASGSGTVGLAGSLAHSSVEFRLAVAAGPQAPSPVRDFVGSLPSTPGAAGLRRLTVTGTANAPQVVR